MPRLTHVSLLALCMLLVACEEAQMAPDEAAKALAAVEAHYLKSDIGGGFLVHTFRTEGQSVVGELLIADREQACRFKSSPASQRNIVFSLACPYAEDAVWTKLKPGQDIKLEVNCKGEVGFYPVSADS